MLDPDFSVTACVVSKCPHWGQRPHTEATMPQVCRGACVCWTFWCSFLHSQEDSGTEVKQCLILTSVWRPGWSPDVHTEARGRTPRPPCTRCVEGRVGSFVLGVGEGVESAVEAGRRRRSQAMCCEGGGGHKLKAAWLIEMGAQAQSCLVDRNGRTSSKLPGWLKWAHKLKVAWLIEMGAQAQSCLVDWSGRMCSKLPGWLKWAHVLKVAWLIEVGACAQSCFIDWSGRMCSKLPGWLKWAHMLKVALLIEVGACAPSERFGDFFLLLLVAVKSW